MNEHQESADQTGADAAAETPPEAPKKRRAPRKAASDAVAVDMGTTEAAPEAVPVAKKPRAPRKSVAAVVPVEPVGEVVAQDLVPAVVDAADVAVPATRPARASRSRKKDVAAEPVVAQDTASTEVAPSVAPAPEPAVEAVVVAPVAAESVPDAAPDAAQEAGAVAPVGEDAGGRRRDRDRQRRKERRGPREEGAASPSGVLAAAAGAPASDGEEEFEVIVVSGGDDEPVDASTLFAEVISGDYDAEVAPDADDVLADPGKRVLRPEPEAPKLHKVLAQAGIGSRREMEQLIQDGQVSVNGEAAHIGMRIAQGDQIRIAGRPIKVRIAPPPARVLAYHKEVGEVVTHHDPEGRPTVFRRLPRLHTGKWLSVGRLDINTEGLLLFTNSGDLANQLMHPRFGVEREYAVRVLGSLATEQRARLLDGVDIEGQKAAFKSIEDGGGEGVNRWYRVVITEGRNREVRKLFDKVGLAVSRLIRIRYGTVVLPRGLKRGAWVELDDQDVRTIRTLASPDQLPQRAAPSESPRGARPAKGRGQDRGQDRGQQDRPDRGGEPRGADRGGRAGEPRMERDAQAPRGKGAQHGGDRGDRGDRQGARPGGSSAGAPQGGQNNRPPRGPRSDGPQGGGRPPRQEGDDPLHIPNPLEQTFDKRFVSGSKRITTGFGRPTEEPTPGGNAGGNRKGEPRQPDPMQTSVGYIGAEAYFTRPGGSNNKGRGGRRR
ncbi:23S rRNA pseudouridine(2605) synthase RluB [Sphaerotilus sp.]|uniref:23S rRNA pseudouridine(2605) synthase RluB n=1 Tax=Sphaerotilus sp. TaxID=2093942 RepID=UPI002ACD6F33|nr:pseudouridine synthase [Sphaerotilus sp.]MDZ7858485.1 pseudouridine synthase [Sphaerotilus sp.]